MLTTLASWRQLIGQTGLQLPNRAEGRRGGPLVARAAAYTPLMSAMLSGVILVAALGLIAAGGAVLLIALFLVTRKPAANPPAGSESGD